MGNCQNKRGRELLKSVVGKYTVVRNEEVDKFIRLSNQMGVPIPKFRKEDKLGHRRQVVSDWCWEVVTAVANLGDWETQMVSLCRRQVPLLGSCLITFATAVANRKFFNLIAKNSLLGLVEVVRLGNFEFLKEFADGRTFGADEIDRAFLVAVRKNFTESAVFLGENWGKFRHKDSRGNTCLIYATAN